MRQLEAERSSLASIQSKLLVNPHTGLGCLQSFETDVSLLINQDQNNSVRSTTQNTERLEFALVVIKLGAQFDVVAKTLKESASEWILYQIGLRIGESLHPTEKAYHINDDEFVVIWYPEALADLTKRLEKLYENLNRHHTLAGVRLQVDTRIGASQYPVHGRNQQSLLHSANLALSQALKTSQNFVIFKETIRKDVVERMELQNGILKALESQSAGADSQFTLAFQPQVSLRTDQNGHLRVCDINAEVLLRWNHPTKGLIPPAQFIPLAEETGLIQPLGTWLVHQAAEQIEAWKGTSMDRMVLSINVSPKQFLNDQLVYSLDRLIRRNPRIASRMKLEITENSLLENTDTCLRYMHYLRSLGLQFAVDDFGRDYSSLSYLSRLPVSTIKIDRSFITNIHNNRHDQIIVRAISRLAKDLRLKVIVEGVENSQQLAFLLGVDCAIIQGFFFSKPVSAKTFATFHKRAIHKRIHRPQLQ
jgi:EAL domain-containing protein (putative c-di-GMP-specific phosphodiesterase class I)/GGDEF domain-containing protein